MSSAFQFGASYTIRSCQPKEGFDESNQAVVLKHALAYVKQPDQQPPSHV